MARQYTAVNLYAVYLALVTLLASTTVSLNSSLEGEQQLNKRKSKLRFQEFDDTILLPRTYLDSFRTVFYDDARLQELKQKLQQLDTKLMEQEKQCQTSCVSNVQSIVETKLMELQKIGQKVEHLETKLLESQIFEQKVQHLIETKMTELQKIDQKVQHLDSKLTELQKIEQKVQELDKKLTEMQKIEQKIEHLETKMTEQEKISQKVEHIETKLLESKIFEQKVQLLIETKTTELQKIDQKVQDLDSRLTELQKIEQKIEQLEKKLTELEKIGQKVEQIETKLLESQIFDQKVQYLIETQMTELQKIDQKVQLLDSGLTELQKIEQKIEQLEKKLTEQEKIGQKVEHTIQTIEQAVEHLESKLTELQKIDQKVQHLDKRLTELQKIKQAVERLESKLKEVEKNGQKIENIETGLTKFQRQYETSQEVIYLRMNETAQILRKHASKGRNFRTCQELHQSDGSLSSGMYWIDPDGHGFEEPIYVHCDMKTGITSVPHDSENSTFIGDCANPGPGCYSKQIKYSAPIQQMVLLANLSTECHQSIRYDCYSSPFAIKGVSQSWWNDRDGVEQHFWAGGDNKTQTCQCGIDKKCVDPSYMCNCDSAAPYPLYDSGVITEKKYLPITKLNFGRMQHLTTSGIFKLGRFECSGQASVSAAVPKSCFDLWKDGHTKSGIYQVMGSKYVETIYCDFARLHHQQGFQKWIGYSDVKSLPVHFYAQKNNLSSTKTTGRVPFESITLNIGGAMDASSGIFTTPRNGIYSFHFTGVVYYPWSGSRFDFSLSLILNGKEVGCSKTEIGPSFYGSYHTHSLHSTLKLKSGDQVWISTPERYADALSIGGHLYDNKHHYTHFTGHLVRERVACSFHTV